jgi:tRNA A-37 threonylcarbamoyl transferase component Bud32
LPDAPTVPLAEVADRYTIERELGRGATAVVYLARDRSTARSVALKVLRPELAESLSAERFLREIRVTQTLSHPHIAPVLDSGVAGGLFYCVLDYMDGGTLRDRLDRERQLPMADIAAITRAVGSALDYAHRNRIIHRDVKPENILFGGGQACLADFGIARALETLGGPTTSTGVVRGTPAYMSPEQASGEREYDGRSDLYSLACVLYEAIAGVPAFAGPNTQAVLAQRLIHVPRPLHVYRPTVTAELDAVMARALATAPADRYQTAASFAEALCTAIDNAASPTAVTAERSAAEARARLVRRRRWMWGGGVGAVAIAAVVLGPLRGSMPWALRVVVDTTRIAVFPVQGAVVGENLLARGFERWRGITLVDQRAVDEQVQRNHAPIGISDGARIAGIVGAGRYVLGALDTTSGSKSVYATLYDIAGHELHHARLPVTADSAAVAVYSAVADSLLLRGQADDGPNAFEAGSRDLPSTQLMIAGQSAAQEWRLSEADTLLVRAARHDTTSGRPLLWLATVREWAGGRVRDWSAQAQSALAKRASLSPTESTMAEALNGLVNQDYALACARYQALIDAEPRSFAGWYGIGECHEKDHAVVRDSRSPSGWRFRSSYRAAVDAYVTAFRLQPESYRGFEANGYSRLRDLLFVSTRSLRHGIADGIASTDFYGSPILVADTIVFVPVPARASMAGAPVVSATQIGAAVARLRTVFQTVTSNWARAAPASGGAKQAVAIALEFMGDPAAIDSFARAQLLEPNPLRQLRLAGTRAYVELKLGAPGDSSWLSKARDLADSLLRAPHGSSPDEAQVLAPMAALAGRCREAAAYLRTAAEVIPGPPIEIPQYIVADANAMLAYVTLGCGVPASIPRLEVLASRLRIPGIADSAMRMAEYNLAAGIIRSHFPLDSAWVDRFAPTSDYLLVAEHDFLHRRPQAAIHELRQVMQKREGSMPGDVTPDAVLPEAQLWLALSDTLSSLAALASTLDVARNYPPLDWSEPSQNVLTIASLIRAMALRAQLGRSNSAEARRWSSAVALLWTNAGPELQPLVRTMRALALR